jgi:tetratricopeptide (TPR) repeat protein
LLDDDKNVRPNVVSAIYRREKSDGDRLLLSVRSRGFERWVPASAVIALTEAESFFSREILRHPERSFAFLMRALVRFVNDDTDLAFADVNDALRLDPKNVTALILRGEMWVVRNRLGQALADVNKAIELDPRSSDSFADRGTHYLYVKEYDKALADFERAIELYSRRATIYVFEGLIYTERHEPEKSEIAFNHALRIDPQRTDALVGLGTIHMMRSERTDALTALNKAIQIDPRCDSAYERRAFLNRIFGDDGQALADLEQAVHLNREGPLYIYNRGFLLYSRAEFDGALVDVETAIRPDPNDDQPHHGRAWILMACPVSRIRNGEQAIVSATRACDLTKWREPRYLATLAAAYSETGDFASAVKWQERAIGNLDLRSSEAGVYHALHACYKGKKPYRFVGSWQGMWLRTE